MIKLPEQYLLNMQKLLGNSYGEFLLSYENPPVKGLRFNIKKVRPETIEKLTSEWNLERVPWCPSGYYYPDNLRPGLSPYHDAGIYYIQEPSAMCVAEYANIMENERVLDLCAAPGGKSTACAERCGVLLSNEIIPERARILSSNIERMGFSNTVVSSTTPQRLASLFPEYFDVVICDAPCSGEGMMRKDETAVLEWSPENVLMCTQRQNEILEYASEMVRPGGRLIYSTCTFEVSENEEQIESFLSLHKNYSLIKQERIWPHLKRGEGHFCAVLIKDGTINRAGIFDAERELKTVERRLSIDKVHILRSGITKGELFTDKKGKKIYVPSHAEILSSDFCSCLNGINIKDKILINEYLKGNVLRLNEENATVKGDEGFVGIYYDGYPLGLGKRSGCTVKNHLPKGLRRLS